MEMSRPLPTPLASVCVFCGANSGTRPAYAMAAREVGAQLARAGLTLVYGGGSIGLMHQCAEAALAEGGKVIGVITEALMQREVGHHGLTELIVVRTMHERKARMATLSDAFIVLPGAYGTFDEMCEMLTWNQLAIVRAPVVLVNVEGYFDGFVMQLARASADDLLRPQHRALLVVVDGVDAAVAALRAWTPPPEPAAMFAPVVP
jgi:uncharacterized protein (TIGR00730 family)